jgi:hypothetical protein
MKTQKILLVTILTICLLVGTIFFGRLESAQQSAPKAKYNFNGRWSSEFSKKETLALTLLTIEDSIKGNFCSVMEYGNRMDCDVDDDFPDISIKGNIYGSDSAIIEFTSAFGGVGLAKLTFINSKAIKWEILREPNSMYFIPKKKILYKNK